MVFAKGCLSSLSCWCLDNRFRCKRQLARSYTKRRLSAAAQQLQDPIWRGNALFRVALYKEAETAYRQADSATAKYNLGNALAYQQKLDEALEASANRLSNRPENLRMPAITGILSRQWISEHRKSPPPPQNRQAKDQPSPQDSDITQTIAEEPGNLMQNVLP